MNIMNLSKEEQVKLRETLNKYKTILKTVDEKIKEHNKELYHYDTEKSLDDVLKEYSLTDVVIATALAINKNDGRYSRTIKQWASDLRTENDLVITDEYNYNISSSLYFTLKYYLEVDTHPAVFNSFAEKVVKLYGKYKDYMALESDYTSGDFQSNVVGGGYPIMIAVNTEKYYAYLLPSSNGAEEFEKAYNAALLECIEYGKNACYNYNDFNTIARSLSSGDDFFMLLELDESNSPFEEFEDEV